MRLRSSSASARLNLAFLLIAASTIAIATSSGPVAADESAPWSTPVEPPRCSTTQARSGDVAGCIVSASGNAGRRGFGAVPDPSITPGFTFGGWSYTGPAERAFADEFITANTVPVAGKAPGTLHTHVAAAALFEGFLAEISARGYTVGSAEGYLYRCTSGTSGTCTSGSISLHASGLAVDINPGANPERTYLATADLSACAVPQQTDLPRWVVEAAESWGLYWGGYGWSSGGCRTPESWSDQIRRDPHHFEFRGTVEMALAIARHRVVPTPPMYCVESAGRGGTPVLSCNRTGIPSAGWRTAVPVDPPRGATAAVVTVTAVGGPLPGFLTAEPCSVDPDATRTTSNTNFAAGRAAANTAIVPLDRSGSVCVWRSAAAHAIVDVVGYLVDSDRADPGAVRRFTPVTPRRATDTRSAGTGLAPAGSVHSYPLGGDLDAVVNVTVADAAGAGFVSADRCGNLVGREPATSTVNHLAAVARANLTFVGTDSGTSCLYTYAAANLIVDVSGVLGTDGLGIAPVPARRVLDTRSCGSTSCAPVAVGSVTRVQGVFADPALDGGVVNVTVTQPTSAGFVSVASCASLSGGAPTTSTVNFAAGDTVANMAFVASGETDLCLYASADVHLIVDVQAVLGATAPTGIALVDPVRAVDTRH